MADSKHRFLYPIFLSFLSVLLCSRASPWQTISTDSSMQADHGEIFLVSPDTTFSCGFYSSGEGTNACYFSIWFTHAADKTVVWTANPGSPVNSHGSKISLNREGNLLLTDVNGSTVWESRTSWGKHTTVALLNSGNLVVRASTDKVVWQSFDSPTDTLLPSQRLTRESRLVSQSGYHLLYFDNDNVLRLLYNGPDITSIYWPSPDYNALQNGRTRFNSSKIAVLDDKGNFLSSDGFRMTASDSGFGIKRRITIDYDGNFRMYSLNASNGNWTVTGEAVQQMCYVHGLCGINGICEYSQSQGLRCTCPPGYEMTDPKNWNKGCRPTFSVSCGQPRGDFTFIKISHGDFYGFDLSSNKSISLKECMQICLDSCLCLSYTYKAGDGLCYTKDRQYNGQVYPYFPGDNYIKLPKKVASTSSASKHSGLTCSPKNDKIMIVSEDAYMKNSDNINWIYFYVFAAILGAIELLFILTGWYFLFKMYDIPKSMEEGYRMITSQFRRFTYRELVEATGKFKEELGKGGSGTVYRGILGDKRVVAVKKLTHVRQGEEEFWAEVTLIGRINHINLVRMWGFCSEGKHRLLVYEYVENKSLDKYLFYDRGTERLLSWSQRFKIALGTARGLAYLHHECLEWVVHCDVKPENILLTRDFEGKIADFGLSKLSKRSSSSFSFTHMRGTMGYMAPEWAMNLPINAKVDVYSYGVVLLEIVTGSRVSSGITIDEEEMDFMQFVQEVKQRLVREDDLDIVDARLKGRFNHEQATMMVKIAVSCLEERSKRPTMDQIAKDLMVYDDEDNHPAYF
ncbi:putative receptor protein kinase ZmPK1 [Phragmites australis]|uniref:putative receptor protein kinase ZmPK1 n=1 Tax=Phragmites australis TaxID=29695 RepID=UPI002D7921DF|nr:putative receptor protein kinase ZmPK1 [Phragmites australis]